MTHMGSVAGTASELQHAGYQVVVARSAEQAAAYLAAWEALAGAASEANVFYAPWALLPALELLKAGRAFSLVFLLRAAAPGEQPALRLDGCFPLFDPRLSLSSPLPVAPLIRHRYCFSVTPLVRAGCEPAVLQAFCAWLHEQRQRYPLLLLRDVPASGALTEALRAALRMRGLRFHEGSHWQRARMSLDEPLEDYLARALSGRERREYRRRANRLAEQGQLVTRLLAPDERELAPWLERFLALEAKGWKGRSQSAMGCQAATRDYFVQLATAAHARGQLLMLELSLDGRPLAMLCDLLDPPGLFAFKIAFDEDYAKFSPGVALILEYLQMREVLKARGVAWMDSCTDPDNLLINRLWQERKPLCSVLISSGAPLADLWVAVYPWAKRLKGWLGRRPGTTGPAPGSRG